MTVLGRVITGMAVVGCCLLTAGCSIVSIASTWGMKVVSFDRVDLDQTAAVVFASPQSSDLLSGPGYLVFIDKTGDFSLVRTEMMDFGHPLWSQSGLFFSDRKYDYRLGPDGLHRLDSPKEAYFQDGFHLLEGGKTRVGVYNLGFTEGGVNYEEEIVVTTKEGVERKVLLTESFVPVSATCGDSVFGVAPLFPSDSVNESQTLVLHRLVNNGIIDGTEIARYKDILTGNDGVSGPKPCVDGIFYDINNQYDSRRHSAGVSLPPPGQDPSQSDAKEIPLAYDPADYMIWDVPGPTNAGGGSFVTIEKWNTMTGELVTVPLTGLQEEGIASDLSAIMFSHMDSNSLQNGKFYWLHSTGILLATDPETGQTSIINDELRNDTGEKETIYEVSFSAGKVSILTLPYSKAIDTTLTTIDLETGKTDETLTIEGLYPTLIDGVELRGLARNPN